jgi:hypothetical protein
MKLPLGPTPSAGVAAVGLNLPDALAGVVTVAALRKAGCVEAKKTPARLHARGGAVAERIATATERRRVALQMVAIHSAEEFVHRHAQCLAFEVPQREVQRADRVQPFASRWIVEGAIHVLPQALDVERVLADEPTCAGLDRVAGAPLTNAGDVGVGLDGDDHVALQQRNLQRHHRRRLVQADARDLGLRQSGLGGERPKQRGCRCDRRRSEKRATIHGIAPIEIVRRVRRRR